MYFVFVSNFFLNFIAGKNVRAMAIFPFIIISSKELKENLELINHEKIHLCQQIECLFIFFYVLYFGFYIYYRLKGQNHYNAYMSIPMEKEAYKNQNNLDYIKNRKFLVWLKYIDEV